MMSRLVTPLRYTPCGQRQADWSWARRGTADREGGFDFSRIRCRPGPTAIKDADVPVGGGIASWKQTGKGSIDPKESFRGKPGLRLENRTPDHSMANQIVAVRPNTRRLPWVDCQPASSSFKSSSGLHITGIAHLW